MPLEIDYRPVVVPLPAVVREAAPVAEEPVDQRAQPGKVSTQRALAQALLRRRAKLRWRIGLAVLLGALPAMLAVLGWGDPHGIRSAAAQTQATHATSVSVAAPAAIALDHALATVHVDADIAPPSAMQSGPAARPTLLAGSGIDRSRALQCLTAAIYYEAAREPDDGQRAVAQVVLNRVAHPAFPKTVCGVVYQGSERPGCQFSFACDGSMAHAPVVAFWLRARRVAEVALAGNVFAPVGLATHYHTSAVHPDWDDAMAFVGTIGAHRFYRWNGNAGAPRAFAAVYTGGEPLAAPHPRTWVSTGADFADPLVLQKAFDAGRLAALRANPAPIAVDPAIVRAGPSFGQQPLPRAQASVAPPVSNDRIAPHSGSVRPEAEQQYDSAAHWIHQPGT